MMIKKHTLFLLALSMLVLASCGSRLPFDPRLYNPSDEYGDAVATPPDVDVEIDPNNDTFQDYQDPDMHFPAENIDSWVIRGQFAANNSPTFWFDTNPSPSWSASDIATEEYLASGPNTSAGANSINTVVYYVYKGMNPLYPSDNAYNTGAHGERVNRFRFYRFTGKTASPSLDNMLVAVDTYTKLVFAFAKPTATESVLGQNVPRQWGSVEANNNGKYMFYEYDPAGIVKEDGTFELYEWYSSAMGYEDYDPIIGDPTREVATYGKAGRSPYYRPSAEEAASDFLANVKGKVFSYRGAKGDSQNLYKYQFNEDASALIFTVENWRRGISQSSTFNSEGAVSAKIATYGGMRVELSDELDTLFVGGVSSGSTGFVDKGALFIDRVKGETFTGAGWTAKFSPDGTKMKEASSEDAYLNDNWDPTVTYYSIGSEDSSYSSASYGSYSLTLSTKSDLSGDKYAISLVDNELKKSNSTAWLLASEIGQDDESLYLESIAGKVYKYRNPVIGYSDILDIYTVSEDGKTITHTQQTWREVEAKNSVEYTFTSASSSTSGTYNNSVVINAQDSSKKISVNGIIADSAFVDKGPSFRDRVKGQTFEGSGYTYVFSSDGRDITIGDTIYQYVGEPYEGEETAGSAHAEYSESFSIGIIPSMRYWGVRVNEDTTTAGALKVEGNQIQWTVSLLNPEMQNLPTEARHNSAWLTDPSGTLPALTDEDVYLASIADNGGQTFYYRSATLTYTHNTSNNSVTTNKEGSRYLQCYVTSSDGRTIRKYVIDISFLINLNANYKYELIDTYTFSKMKSDNQSIEGIYLNSKGEECEFEARNGGIHEQVNNTDITSAYKDFNDAGPVFQDIVAGRTYTENDTNWWTSDKANTWKFSPDGTRMLHTAAYQAELGSDFNSAYYVYGGVINESSQSRYMGCYGRMTSYNSSTAVEAMKVAGEDYKTLTFSSVNVRFDMHTESNTSSSAASLWRTNNE